MFLSRDTIRAEMVKPRDGRDAEADTMRLAQRFVANPFRGLNSVMEVRLSA